MADRGIFETGIVARTRRALMGDVDLYQNRHVADDSWRQRPQSPASFGRIYGAPPQMATDNKPARPQGSTRGPLRLWRAIRSIGEYDIDQTR